VFTRSDSLETALSAHIRGDSTDAPNNAHGHGTTIAPLYMNLSWFDVIGGLAAFVKNGSRRQLAYPLTQ
jgi:hypothetical protein